ncbi:MAG TPA: hypothetical protein VGI10_26845 [Polyangiaceae bacterium]|jgi:hypothetical protein
MSEDPSPPEPSVPSEPLAESDRDLEELPAPRRPWRRATLGALALCAVGSLWLTAGLREDAAFALKGGPPRDIGELASAALGPELTNTWVRGSAALRADGAVHYARPLEHDSYRLARIEGSDKLWVQVRVPFDPSDPDGEHFVPPTSFVGRLLPVRKAGIRHSIVPSTVADTAQGNVADDAWFLIDDEAPQDTRWTLGLVGLFLGFAAFSVTGLVRLTQKVN